jgi:hypothetical protein
MNEGAGSGAASVAPRGLGRTPRLRALWSRYVGLDGPTGCVAVVLCDDGSSP